MENLMTKTRSPRTGSFLNRGSGIEIPLSVSHQTSSPEPGCRCGELAAPGQKHRLVVESVRHLAAKQIKRAPFPLPIVQRLGSGSETAQYLHTGASMLPSTPLALRVSPSLRRASFLRHRTAPATTHSASDGPAHKSDWDAREAGPVIRSGMPFQTPYYGSPGKEISGASSMARGVKTAAAGVHGDGDGECQGGIQRLAGRSPQESAGENECRSDDQEQDGSEDGWGADAEGDLDVGPENGDGVFATTPSTPPPAPECGTRRTQTP
ncbi:unnamed protein product [Diplocarpon coronariae]